MSNQKFDPSQLIVGTRVTLDTNAEGVITVDKNSEWLSGTFVVELFDRKTGQTLGTHREHISRKKYEALREDFDKMSTADVVKEYFSDVETDAATQTDLQREADRSEAETRAKKAEAEVEELKRQLEEAQSQNKKEAKTYDDFRTTPEYNVVPVGNTTNPADHPEGRSAAEQVARGGNSAEAPDNPEQVAPGVPEDSNNKRDAQVQKESITNGRETNVVPVKEDTPKKADESSKVDVGDKNPSKLESPVSGEEALKAATTDTRESAKDSKTSSDSKKK